jgi:hypothetical protein
MSKYLSSFLMLSGLTSFTKTAFSNDLNLEREFRKTSPYKDSIHLSPTEKLTNKFFIIIHSLIYYMYS